MKAIIDGKKYDTETAKNVGFYSSYGSFSDFNHLEETLFLKKTGEFFLYGKGGPNTKYAIQTDMNSWAGGVKIVPLSENDAKAWAEKNLTVDEYESLFGEVEE